MTRSSTVAVSETVPLRLHSVEALRALAAFMIVIYHMTMISEMELPQYLNIIKGYFGHGVPLFYALSGFVLAYGYFDKLNSRTEIIQFYTKRYFRIAPLFYAMMLVWFITAKLKWNVWQGSFHDVVLNLSLLFGLIPGKHESLVWAGWSIGVEVLFYVAFPIIISTITSLSAAILGIALSILISSAFYSASEQLAVGSYAYMNIVTHFPTFLCGILAYFVWRHYRFASNRIVGATLLIGATGLSIAVIYAPAAHSTLLLAKGVRLDLYIWSAIFTLLILALCFWPVRALVNPISTTLGRISFSCYLWHPLIVLLLLESYTEIGKRFGLGLLPFVMCSVLTLSAVVAVSLCSFRWIEEPGMKWGRRVVHKS